VLTILNAHDKRLLVQFSDNGRPSFRID